MSECGKLGSFPGWDVIGVWAGFGIKRGLVGGCRGAGGLGPALVGVFCGRILIGNGGAWVAGEGVCVCVRGRGRSSCWKVWGRGCSVA